MPKGGTLKPDVAARRDKIEAAFRADPTLTVKQLSDTLGETTAFVRVGLQQRGLTPANGRKESHTDKIREYFALHPTATVKEGAAALGLNVSTVGVTCAKYKLGSRKYKSKHGTSPAAIAKELVFELKAAVMDLNHLRTAIETDEPKVKQLRRIGELIELFTEATDRLTAAPAPASTGETDAVPQI